MTSMMFCEVSRSPLDVVARLDKMVREEKKVKEGKREGGVLNLDFGHVVLDSLFLRNYN
jgi:hypothetical protein